MPGQAPDAGRSLILKPRYFVRPAPGAATSFFDALQDVDGPGAPTSPRTADPYARPRRCDA